MDLRMPDIDGVTAIKLLAERHRRAGAGADHLRHRQRRGARDRGRRDRLPAQGLPAGRLLRAVRAAARGEAVLSPSVATRLIGQVRRRPGTAQPARARGARAGRAGRTNREAAARLFISEATVKTHLLHIYAKLGVNDRAAAVATAFDRGLLPRP